MPEPAMQEQAALSLQERLAIAERENRELEAARLLYHLFSFAPLRGHYLRLCVGLWRARERRVAKRVRGIYPPGSIGPRMGPEPPPLSPQAHHQELRSSTQEHLTALELEVFAHRRQNQDLKALLRSSMPHTRRAHAHRGIRPSPANAGMGGGSGAVCEGPPRSGASTGERGARLGAGAPTRLQYRRPGN